MLKKLKNLKLLTGDSTFSQLFRTYLVGAFNLVFSLVISYLFQFFIFYSIDIPLRTYSFSVELKMHGKLTASNLYPLITNAYFECRNLVISLSLIFHA